MCFRIAGQGRSSRIAVIGGLVKSKMPTRAGPGDEILQIDQKLNTNKSSIPMNGPDSALGASDVATINSAEANNLLE